MNILSYEEATIYDIRTYDKYYLSLIKSKHFLISIFYERDDYNINIIKKYLFFFTFAINYSVCILFYNYKTFHKIYEEKGSFNFSYQFPKMLYSSLITILFYNLLSKFIYYENNLLVIKKSKLEDADKVIKTELNKIFLKFVSFFIVTYILLFFCWIYSISFCVVYKNTQTHLLISAIISFIITCIIPFILYLIPGVFRIYSSNHQRVWIYNLSKYLQLFLC